MTFYFPQPEFIHVFDTELMKVQPNRWNELQCLQDMALKQHRRHVWTFKICTSDLVLVPHLTFIMQVFWPKEPMGPKKAHLEQLLFLEQ